MKLWHVVHSKPQKEALLCEQLCLRRIETYDPLDFVSFGDDPATVPDE